ncbi:H-type lectin domain-containing protein [Rhodobacteraceae bacterium N5(2021)]|uniref:H-type lectin domain-containing protein n=1 Tax=Gymnodinialimonas phycosphaerae TaxID=2841589 RepID=A0A975YFS1_9RHOB|nr:H-type lectin domain-containing protein [Gymnodinialimonas phycosphaerae]MBY4895095.1 H-type lectin domain-containing protein [Gymnodinialimonas phycosphaerae]
MKRFKNNLIAVDQGSSVMFSDFANNGPMWSGDGPRESVTKVEFGEPYLAPPMVHVSISMWDTGGNTNQRADLRAEKITRTGCDLVFRTWGDSRIARIRADWMAIGEVPDEDAWDVG